MLGTSRARVSAAQAGLRPMPTVLHVHAVHFFNVLWVMPMFAWDVFRQRVVPRAYLSWAGLTFPLMAVAEVLWNSPRGWRLRRGYSE